MEATQIDNPRSGRNKRRSTFAVLFYINRTKIRKNGMCQLLCRISIDAEWEQVGTKVSVDPTLWNPETGRADGRSRNACEVNTAIDKLTAQIHDHYLDIQSKLGFVTAEFVKNALKGIAQKPLTLIKLFEEHNTEFASRVGVDRNKEALDVYKVTCKHLRAFIRKRYDDDDVSLRSLNLEFFDAFDLFLRTDKGLQQKTIHQHLYNLKKMTKRAVSQGTLRRDPFMTMFPELPPLRSRHLKESELQRLLACKTDDPKLQRVRDWFVFSTFTGLALVDLRRLSTEHLSQSGDGSWWIHMKRQKTGTDSTVRLLEIPLQIMEKYRHERKDERIFNVYRRDDVYKLIKEVGKLCGIKTITFHKARHNFGTHITLSQGVPIETVSRMMGHKNISTTQIYARVTDKKVAEDMKRLKRRTSGNNVSLYEDEDLRELMRYPKAVKRSN